MYLLLQMFSGMFSFDSEYGSCSMRFPCSLDICVRPLIFIQGRLFAFCGSRQTHVAPELDLGRSVAGFKIWHLKASGKGNKTSSLLVLISCTSLAGSIQLYLGATGEGLDSCKDSESSC